MPKRKAKELENEVLPAEPRRSSRRISTAKDKVSPETTSNSAPKKSKKTQKITQGDDQPIVNGKDDQKSESVGSHWHSTFEMMLSAKSRDYTFDTFYFHFYAYSFSWETM